MTTPPIDESSERFVNDVEMARQLGVTPVFVHKMCARGLLEVVQVGIAFHFPLQSNLARIATLRKTGSP